MRCLTGARRGIKAICLISLTMFAPVAFARTVVKLFDTDTGDALTSYVPVPPLEIGTNSRQGRHSVMFEMMDWGVVLGSTDLWLLTDCTESLPADESGMKDAAETARRDLAPSSDDMAAERPIRPAFSLPAKPGAAVQSAGKPAANQIFVCEDESGDRTFQDTPCIVSGTGARSRISPVGADLE